MGVEIVPGVEFNDVLEPETEMDSWKLSVKPLDHAINNRGIDVVIGAEDCDGNGILTMKQIKEILQVWDGL